MVLLSTGPQPDFSGYYKATGTIGFILIIAGVTTVGRTYVVIPFPHYVLALAGVGFVLHALHGLRKDKKQQRKQNRMSRSKQDYERTTVENPDMPDIADEDEELPESPPRESGGNP